MERTIALLTVALLLALPAVASAGIFGTNPIPISPDANGAKRL